MNWVVWAPASALARIESARATILEGPMVKRNANHREVWLRDPNGYTAVVSGRYGDVVCFRPDHASTTCVEVANHSLRIVELGRQTDTTVLARG